MSCCVGKELGLPDEAIHAGLASCVVKGRVELVPISKKFTILLDYAHNEVSTESLLTTLRAYKPNRLVVVFGCGGNRSKLRRYGMGEICAKMADFSILTEDNNRFEKIEDILADIREGMNRGNPDAPFVEIPDRLDALHYAVDHAQPGDIIAVIGKGHETYRDRMGEKTPFLERELLEAVNEIGICPQGFGGKPPCLGLAIEQMPTHVACLPVAVNVSCHVTRRATVTL